MIVNKLKLWGAKFKLGNTIMVLGISLLVYAVYYPAALSLLPSPEYGLLVAFGFPVSLLFNFIFLKDFNFLKEVKKKNYLSLVAVLLLLQFAGSLVMVYFLHVSYLAHIVVVYAIFGVLGLCFILLVIMCFVEHRISSSHTSRLPIKKEGILVRWINKKRASCLVCGEKILLVRHISVTGFNGAECQNCHSYMFFSRWILILQLFIFILLFPWLTDPFGRAYTVPGVLSALLLIPFVAACFAKYKIK